jgi:hypothetical protein
MANISSGFDEYALRARVAPTLVVIVIPVVGLLCWFPAFSTTQLALAAALSTVLLAMFSQFGRDQGKALQRKRPTNPCPRRYPPAGRPRGAEGARWRCRLVS